MDSSQLTVSTSSLSEADLQPEDQDEELEMSLRSQGSTLAELYPSTISEIGRAKHQQYISEAAGSVLRRYRRWRCLSNRSNLESTLNITQRHAQKFPKKIKSKHTLEDTSNSPLTRHFRGMSNTGSITARPSPDKAIHLQDWQTQLQSRWRDRRSLRRDQQQPVHVMDLSGRSETSKPERTKQNKTSTVTQLSSPFFSQLGEESFCGSTVSTSHLYSPSAKAFLDLPLRSKRLSLSAHSPQKAGCSMNAYETGFQERPDIYRSPVRQSPLKARMVTRERLSKSPYAFSRRPTSDSVGSYSREPVRSRSQSTFLSSPLHKPTMSQRMLYSQDSWHSPQLPLYSPQPAHHRLRRHLSFDSSLPLVSYSEKEIDEEFKRLYHKFVCQNKSFHFNSPPCRLCASSSEARDHSSQTLAALALSPHRFVQKKRHREEDWEIHSESKRSREGYCTYSPGSKRNGKEMLRRRLCPSGLEVSHAGCSHGGGVQQSFRSQQLSADATEHQGRPASAATFSDIGKLPFITLYC